MTTVTTKTLIAELSWIDRFVEKKSTIPVLTTVLMKASGEFLKLSATDLETAGVTFCDVSGNSNWATCVPVKALLKYLAKVEEKELSLTGSNEGLTVEHAGNKVTIDSTGALIESYPELPTDLENVGTIGQLADVIPQIAVSISQESSRFTLNGALLAVRNGAAVMVSTDGHRLSHVELADSAFSDDFKVLVPEKALSELGRIVKDSNVRVAANENFVSFCIGNRKIISRKLTGNFPDYERVMPRDFPTTFSVDQKPLTKLVERVKTMADTRMPAAKWELTEGVLSVSAGVSETHRAQGSVKVEAPDCNWNAGLDCNYALDFLKLADDVTISVKDAGSAAVFQSGSWKYIVMPCRI